MANVTISKKEYQKLLDAQLRFDYMKQLLENDLFSPPPIKDMKSVILSFRKTKKYNRKFLKSLEDGLKRSRYFAAV